MMLVSFESYCVYDYIAPKNRSMCKIVVSKNIDENEKNKLNNFLRIQVILAWPYI